jgi:hypothetical protein
MGRGGEEDAVDMKGRAHVLVDGKAAMTLRDTQLAECA